jgi:nitrate reductase gamma subunit
MTDPATSTHPIPVHADAQAPAKVISPAVRVGLYTGALLTIVMIGSLIAANRLSWLDNRALERNGASYGLFLAIMLVPIFRFLNRPLKMYYSAMLAWGIFVIAYDIAGMFFHSLFQALRSPFEAFLEGAVVYGVCAVGSWVGGMILLTRRHRVAPRRRRSDFFTTHHQ